MLKLDNELINSRRKNVRVIGPDSNVTGLFFNAGFSVDNIKDPDLVVFTGGADINPLIYKQNPIKECGVIFHDRDRRELAAYEKYKDIPKVGICRGAQLLNVLSGGSMYQHVTGHHGQHQVTNLLGNVYKESLVTNSCHHQMMIPGKDGELLAFSDRRSTSYLADPEAKLSPPEVDVEVVYYDTTKSLCFQAHPEWYPAQPGADCPQYFIKLIQYLL